MNSHQQPIIRGSGHSHNAPFNIDLDVVLQLGRIEDADLPDDELRKYRRRQMRSHQDLTTGVKADIDRDA
jgi:hypothetical protein